MSMVVFRPTAVPGSFTVVAESPIEALTESVLNTFPVNVGVQGGDLLGLWAGGGAACMTDTGAAGDIGISFPDSDPPPVGSTVPGANPLPEPVVPAFSGFLENISATLVPDVPPTAAPTQSPAANGAGWNKTDVTVAWNWMDAGGSGIDSANCTTTSTVSAEGVSPLTATCNDLAGSTGTASYTVMVDKTPPTVTINGNAGSYGLLATVDITCTATDKSGGSGLVSDPCTAPLLDGPAWSFGAGSHPISVTAGDLAGNSTTATGSFTVTVSSADLCTLTGQFVDGSAKYTALHGLGKVVVDALVKGACSSLTRRQAFVNTYKQGVQALVKPGWLTQAQATTLGGLAEAL